ARSPSADPQRFSTVVRMRVARSIAVLVAVFALAACTRAHESSADQSTTVRAVDEPLPTLSGPTVDGGQVSSQDFLGKVLVVNVWANWCTPCQLEQPELVQVANRYAKHGVELLRIDHMEHDAATQARAV